MAISTETVYISIATAVGIAFGVFLCTWGLGKFYKLGKLKRAATYFAGMLIAATSGAFVHLLFDSLYVSVPIAFLAGIGGFTAVLWFSSSAGEPASFTRLFSVGAFMFFFFVTISMATGILIFALISFVTAPNPTRHYLDTKETRNLVIRLRQLYSAEEIYRTRNGKYGTLDELAKGKFFDPDDLSEENTGYVVTLEIFDDSWHAVAVPDESNYDLPGFRIDESGLIRYRKDGLAPTSSHPVYR
ncbi:MAG: hypothetical protein ACYS8W_00680 [Planctomycetota bacterium]|jgi:hypothetical protein